MFNKVKDVAKRGTLLLGAVGLAVGIGASAVPAFMPLASADALNPLTDRSLTLSSSSPGWSYTDGSGNSTYAPPNSGANGQKTGNTFDFKVSTDSSTAPAINGFTFQYCTLAAGSCEGPGNDANGTGTGTITVTSGSTAVTGTGTTFTTQAPAGSTITTAGGHTYTVASVTDNTDLVLTTNAAATETGVTFLYRNPDSVTNQQSDLNVVVNTPTEVASGDFATYVNSTTGAVSAVVPADNTKGNFVVLTKDSGASSWSYSGGWSMSAGNLETGSATTGKQNFVTLLNSGTGLQLHSTGEVKVVFFATNTNYITNPGSSWFFVKINDYNDAKGTPAASDLIPTDNEYGTSACTAGSACIVDGGVTVANVMNQSIELQTKVLETMEFSVGTVDPDTVAGSHTACDSISTGTGGNNTLAIGNSSAENSLSVNQPYDTYSYWRLSSNSSNGATVYYSGNTLANTENNSIGDIYNTAGTGNNPSTGLPWAPGDGSADYSRPGSEQFGLGIAANDTATAGQWIDDYSIAASDVSSGYSQNGANIDSGFSTDVTTNNGGVGKTWHLPMLYPLVPDGNYGLADAGTASIATAGANAQFAFDNNATLIPAPIADESNQVVNCSTGEMRYIANIAATTPAGIYTTKVNYIAAPEY